MESRNGARQVVTPLDREAMLRFALGDPSDILAGTRSALLLVDVQNRFIYPQGRASTAAASVMRPIADLLAAARSLRVPRVYVTAGSLPGPSGDTPAWLRRLADIVGEDPEAALSRALGPTDHDIPEAIAPLEDEPRFYKHRYSAFFRTGLETYLNALGTQSLVIVGVASYGCIAATAVDASCRGFFSFVPVEATAGENTVLHEAAMRMIGPRSTTDVPAVIGAWEAAMRASKQVSEVRG